MQDLKLGGPWLGAARSWIQWRCRNGSDVLWGSDDVLGKTFTVRDVEDIALRVAEAHQKDIIDSIKRHLTVLERIDQSIVFTIENQNLKWDLHLIINDFKKIVEQK